MKKAVLLLLGLFFACRSYAETNPVFVSGCISPNGTTITLIMSSFSAPVLYLYINGINVDPGVVGNGIGQTSIVTDPNNSSYVDLTYDITPYGATLTTCTNIIFSLDPNNNTDPSNPFFPFDPGAVFFLQLFAHVTNRPHQAPVIL